MIIAVKLDDMTAMRIAEGTVTIEEARDLFNNWSMNALVLDPLPATADAELLDKRVVDLVEELHKNG